MFYIWQFNTGPVKLA